MIKDQYVDPSRPRPAQAPADKAHKPTAAEVRDMTSRNAVQKRQTKPAKGRAKKG